uniref:Uncharacterized protein n=1 Tax=Romanomermis culicivorax TaxID=13658 RepID=A0A915HQ13_ROMCU
MPQSEHSRKESIASSQKSSASIKSVLSSYKRHRGQGVSESSTSSATSSQRGRKRKVKSKSKFSDACIVDKFVIQDVNEQMPSTNQVNNCSNLTLRADDDKCVEIDIASDEPVQFTLDIDDVSEQEAGPSSLSTTLDVFRPRPRLMRRNSNLPPLQSTPRLLQDYRPPMLNYSNLVSPTSDQKIVNLTFPGFDDVDNDMHHQ